MNRLNVKNLMVTLVAVAVVVLSGCSGGNETVAKEQQRNLVDPTPQNTKFVPGVRTAPQYLSLVTSILDIEATDIATIYEAVRNGLPAENTALVTAGHTMNYLKLAINACGKASDDNKGPFANLSSRNQLREADVLAMAQYMGPAVGLTPIPQEGLEKLWQTALLVEADGTGSNAQKAKQAQEAVCTVILGSAGALGV